MNPKPIAKIAQGKPLDRAGIVTILNGALQAGENRFARRLAAHWLDTYPGDLGIELLQAQALLGEGLDEKALPILKKLVNVDPEYVEAQRMLAQAAAGMKYSTAEVARACLAALEGDDTPRDHLPPWGTSLAKARLALDNEDIDQAEILIQQALLEDPPTPLPAVFHLKFAVQYYDWLAVRSLLDLYLARWPDCLVCNLLQADSLMEGGEEDRAVALLHRCAAQDVLGQVPARLWGEDHPFRALWPGSLEVTLDLPIPAAVAGALGWNQLPRGPLQERTTKEKAKPEPASARRSRRRIKTPRFESQPESLVDVQAEIERIAQRLKQEEAGRADGRFPVYVVLSSRQGLESEYGKENLLALDKTIRQVIERTQRWPSWDALLLYADDRESTGKLGLQPAKADDPWSIKNLLADLDETLRLRGEMIGALLIVGGPRVVPFHHLPNPVDDEDVDVPSDNPYATTDENYFIASWPVGRLPGDASRDPTPLLKSLHAIATWRERQTRSQPRLKSWWQRFLGWLLRRKPYPSFGYTAEVWQRASHSVFRAIGSPRALLVSPPVQAESLSSNGHQPVHLGYYNLHGLVDSAEWYGQRDPIETPTGPDYPVALRPQDVVNGGRSPQVVFSEACYGAHVIDKTLDSALALKFLSAGSQAVVGSTCTSYGSITTPLIAADLLGLAFWKYLQEGHPAGEALRRGKIHLAREMHRRQGYLDGEDQKTLISFVLYGDPLAQPEIQGRGPKNILRPRQDGRINTVCDRIDGPPAMGQRIPPEVVAHVKQVVKAYLPGMADAKVVYSQEHTECRGHLCPTTQLGAKARPPSQPERRVVTLRKDTLYESNNHPRYARITLDKGGKVVKLAVSR